MSQVEGWMQQSNAVFAAPVLEFRLYRFAMTCIPFGLPGWYRRTS